MEANTDKRIVICVDENIPYLRGRLEPFAEVRYVEQDSFAPEVVRDADAMIIRTRTRCGYPLLRGSKVKMIATATIGMDQFNLKECAEMGIRVANAPGCNAPAVSQYVWASILHMGIDPEQITIGIVGHGNVGSIVEEWARLLGAKVRIYDPYKERDAKREGRVLTDYCSLDQLLAESDVVTLHTPFTKEGEYPTYHLISEREIKLMKPGSVIINAARGPVSDTSAVKYGIKERGMRVVIDCWEGEPVIDRELMELAEIATFHIAGYSVEGKQRATRMAVEAIADFFGFTPDMSGLEGPYIHKTSLDKEKIMRDFDPYKLTERLRKAPELFDISRARYELRPES
jgi:erythronate-4-phosphate dehydrogenase